MNRSIYGRCHPDNIWALQGLLSCLLLKRTGQSECCGNEGIRDAVVNEEIGILQAKITEMAKVADIEIGVACMCAIDKK